MIIGQIIRGVMKKNKTASYHEYLIENLKNSEEAAGYLNAALEESDMPGVFLAALRNVAEAHGISQLAHDAHLSRENLYRILSHRGNPQISSLYSILNALGLSINIATRSV